MPECLDRVPCGYLALSDAGVVVAANAALLALLGRGAEGVVGTPFADLLTPGAVVFCQTHLFPLLRLEGRADEIYLSVRARDGGRLPVLLNAVRDTDATAPVTHCAVVLMRQRSRYEDEILRAKKELELARAALDRDVERRKRVERQLQDANRRLESVAMRDRAVAATLQENLLPTLPPDRVPGFRVRAFHHALLPEAGVGGDFYDLFPLGGDRWALVVGDVVGKGLTAALSIAEVKFTLRGFLRESGGDLSSAFTRLNRFVCESNRLEARPRQALVALSAAVLDPRGARLTVTAAGAESPLLVRPDGSEGERGRDGGTDSDGGGSGAAPTAPPDGARRLAKRTGVGEVISLDAGGLILGVDADADLKPGLAYPTVEVPLAPGDLIAMFTDGLIEARGMERGVDRGAGDAGRPLFGSSRLGDALLNAAADARRSAPNDVRADYELPAIGETVIENARAFGGGAFQDDVCLLLAHNHSPHSPLCRT